ncbi:MAG: hypothetical protein H6834_06780 [Planctomycetes bacterium]|nr:hypothetical protein [Planctomycetota bacterium]
MSHNGQGRKGVIFLTLPPDLGRGMLESAKMRFPDVQWTTYLRDEHREILGDHLAGMRLRRDKPDAGKLRFVREMRKEGYAIALVGWTGDPRFNRMKGVALLSGAAEKYVYNENLDSFRIEGGKNPVWLQHARWRLRSGRSRTGGVPLRRLLLCYKWTIGLLVGSLRLWVRTLVLQTRRSMASR